MIEEIKFFNQAINNFINNTSAPSLKKSSRAKSIFFLRNEQVENFASKINYYSSLTNLKFKFSFSGYDNNLPITKKTKSDISIIWLDYLNYKINNDFYNWIKFKADELSKLSEYVLIKPILIPKIEKEEIKKINKKYKKIFKNEKIIFLDIVDDLLETNRSIWDIKRSDFFGTKTSLYGQDFQSKILGLKVLPSIFKQKIKSIIFDLDDTLYTGVVGEDGISKIYLDTYQKKANKLYTHLGKKGTLLSICSKNNEKDAELIFKKKILNKKIFFPIKANWDLKSKNIEKIKKILKISHHNILFIDNNISEIIEVKKKYPDINVFWSDNSKSFLNCLKYYPNLVDYYGYNFNGVERKRVDDLKASLKREKILSENKKYNHFEILKMKIDYKLNNQKEFDRIFSLTNKVNQFIFNYKRFSKIQVKDYFKNNNKFIFTISLKDKFSDSGNIGVVYFSKINNTIYLDELCLSCRALGRNLEDYFLFFPLQILSKKYQFNTFKLNFVNGPKNMPAKKYFIELQKKFLKRKNKNSIEIPYSHIKNKIFKNKDISLRF